MEILVQKTKVKLLVGDVTQQAVDAIVNAANSRLIHGGGVAGAIVRKGGKSIQDESYLKAPVPVGQAVITSAGALPCNYVIHAVGPRMGEGNEDEKLKNATLNCLRIAEENKLSSIAFCAISTGIFGYPMNRCADVMLTNTLNYLNGHTELKEVIFCLYDQKAYNIFSNTLEKLKPNPQ
jgi:O-acetyl-ADP-ribose deacetylase (regulator of RNase III)